MAGVKFSQGASKFIAQQMKGRMDELAQDALKKTADDVAEKMTEFIKEYFYSAMPEGDSYKRTEQLLRSVTQTKMKKVGTTYQIYIFLNPDKEGDYDNKGSKFPNHERYYIDDFGRMQFPNSGLTFDANSVFNLASQGIHGLPKDSLSSGWTNNNYKEQSAPNFWDMINKEIDTSDILRRYSEYIRRIGYDVVTK